MSTGPVAERLGLGGSRRLAYAAIVARRARRQCSAEAAFASNWRELAFFIDEPFGFRPCVALGHLARALK